MHTRTVRKSATTHSKLIRALAKKYEEDGYWVQADHIDHPNGCPPQVNGHVPDVAAYSGGTLKIIAEAETCDTLDDDHTRSQWSAFSRSPYRFDVIVPKRCLEAAKAQARTWGVNVDRWWWLDV